MKIFVYGYPSSFGGADTELWHVLLLWKRFGLSPHLLTTGSPHPTWRTKCDKLGLETTSLCEMDWRELAAKVGHSIIVSFCNREFLQIAPEFRQLGCKLVWVNCMTWLFDDEIKFCANNGAFDAHVFQSEFQLKTLSSQLRAIGVAREKCHLIRGALSPEEFPYVPRSHRPGNPFTVGKLARNDPDKWHVDLWKLMEAIGYRPLRAKVMGWSSDLEKKLGSPPRWAKVLGPCAEDSHTFLSDLDLLLPMNGGARENWPRVGLEAMSTGVPIVAPNKWGWKEMIEHGRTGFLASDEEEIATYSTRLARDELLRRNIVRQARERLVDELANRERIWARWADLFRSIR